MTDVAAGWYPDPTLPAGSAGLRYWDGQAWTEHVHAPMLPPRPTQPTSGDGVALAGWGQRVLAYLIDFVPFVVLSMIVGLAAIVSSGQSFAAWAAEPPSETGGFATFWFDPETLWWQLPLDLAFAAYLVGMLRWRGATLGKMAVGIRVRLWEQPGRLPWSAVLLRVALAWGITVLPTYVAHAGLVSLGGILFGPVMLFSLIDVLWPLWDDRRQAIHDKPARTCVVRVR